MKESTRNTLNSILQLLIVAALLVIGYICTQTLRSTSKTFNLVFVSAFLATPFLAIRPLLRLRRWCKILGFILLTPLLLLSSFLLLFTIVIQGFSECDYKQTLQTYQVNNYTIELAFYANGGAIGIHGLNLEQRRLIFPGLYLVKSVDSFDSAWEGTLSVDGPNRVKVHAKGSYYNNDLEINREYLLKPWIYF